MLRLAARADGADGLTLADRRAAGDADRPEMDERHRIPVGGSDGDHAPADGHRPGEGDRAGGRRAHSRFRRSADIDAAVLAAGVGIVAEHEWSKHRPIHGPGPGECGRSADLEREEDRKQDDETLHRLLLLVVCYGNTVSVTESSAVVKRGYKESR
jgi:hypothetical protein